MSRPIVQMKPSAEGTTEHPRRRASQTGTHHIFMSGCSRVLMRFTIQLNSRPYKALDMASRTSAALSTVLVRMMVSPLVTTHWEVRASWSSSEPMLRRDAAEGKHKISLCPLWNFLWLLQIHRKESRHLGLTKQIGKSLLLEN